MTDDISPFRLSVPQAELDELRLRLGRTRWPEPATVPDWSQGVPLDVMRRVCAYWQDGYDWRRCEAMLNGFGQFRTEIDGLNVHFLHLRSPRADALPLILTHGWPGSVIEFHNVMRPLADPEAHGAPGAQAFHVVAPSLPGFGFSGKPQGTGWTSQRIAKAWITLMKRLGYPSFVAQGGDWGAAVTVAMGASGAPEVAGIHLNMVSTFPAPEDLGQLNETEQAALADFQRYMDSGSGYSKQQSTRPQTLGYGLVDSPAGQAAWIYEKYAEWTDSGGEPERVLSLDEMLDNIMLYWLPGTAASSGRLYWEGAATFAVERVEIPVACSIFPKELFRVSRRWAERKYPNIVYWNELDRGGHFAAFEQPDLFVSELRRAFRGLR